MPEDRNLSNHREPKCSPSYRYTPSHTLCSNQTSSHPIPKEETQNLPVSTLSMIPFASDFVFPNNNRRSSSIFDPFFVGGEFWDPFQSFNNLANNALSFPSSSFGETSQFASTRLDWKETPEAHVFKADLPGIKKEEVKVEIEEGKVLQISGERSRESEEKGDQWHRVERSSGSFLRRFRLPENVKVDQVKAAMEDGVLTVTVPKIEKAEKPEVKSIEISG